MSIDALQIACTGCDYEGIEAFQTLRVVYRTGARHEVDGRSMSGWCYHCDGYSRIENIDSTALAHELRELEAAAASDQTEVDELSKKLLFKLGRRSAKYRRGEVKNQRTAQRIADLQNLYAIVAARSSKPSCLVCGSHETAALNFEDGATQKFRHKCGGRLRVFPHPRGLRFNFGRDVRCHVLNEAGNRIETRVEQRKRACIFGEPAA